MIKILNFGYLVLFLEGQVSSQVARTNRLVMSAIYYAYILKGFEKFGFGCDQ